MRGILDRSYRQYRGTSSAIDPKIDSRDLIRYLTRRGVSRVRGQVLGGRAAFRESYVTVMAAHRLQCGSGVSLGMGSILDCLGENGIRLGDNVTIDRYAVLRASGVIRNQGVGITIGPFSSVGAFNILLGQGGLSIGSNCLLGPQVTIVSENHNTGDRGTPIRDQGETRAAVNIADDVWIGAGATILAGVRLGHGSVVAAGAVVSRSVEAFSVVAGVPARVVATRGDET